MDRGHFVYVGDPEGEYGKGYRALTGGSRRILYVGSVYQPKSRRLPEEEGGSPGGDGAPGEREVIVRASGILAWSAVLSELYQFGVRPGVWPFKYGLAISPFDGRGPRRIPRDRLSSRPESGTCAAWERG
jgi:hypothetical protein